MVQAVLRSGNFAKGGFVVFYEDRLLFVSLNKSFAKDKHGFMRNKSGDFVDWIIQEYQMQTWEEITKEFNDLASDELQERFEKLQMIPYKEVYKFKLSGSYKTLDAGVEIFLPGTFLIKSEQGKISMDHDYKESDEEYKQCLAALRQ